MFNTFLQFFHLFIYLFIAIDPREPSYPYEEGNFLATFMPG